MGVEETDDALLPPPKVGKAVSSLAPCHLKNESIKIEWNEVTLGGVRKSLKNP